MNFNYPQIVLAGLIIFLCIAARAEPSYLSFVIFLSIAWFANRLDDMLEKYTEKILSLLP